MRKEEVRIVFMGTPEFAVPTLDAIINEGYNVVGIITAPDKKAGRGRKISMSAIKEYALKKSLNILQPNNLKDETFLKELKELKPSLQIVVAFRMLPKVVWSLPELGTFNLHASLLPQYRGAAPINYALINGESKTGLTTFFLDEKIDTGEIIEQVDVDIDSDDDAGTLHDKLMTIGSKLVIDTIKNIISQKVALLLQSSTETNLKQAPKLHKEDCRINWNTNPETIYNFVRGLSPYPAAFSTLVADTDEEITAKIYKVEIISNDPHDLVPGTILSDSRSYLNVAVNNGIIQIKEIQLSGKKRMKTVDLLRGFNKILNFNFS